MSKYGNKENTYSRFLDFQGKYYWSSQPAYIQNYAYTNVVFDFYGYFYYDDYGQTNFDKNNKTDRANIGSARATKVVYTNDYQSTPSGTNGYYSFYDSKKDDFEYSGEKGPWGDKHTIGTIEREPGNLPRNAMARVRCVRKMN